MEIKGNYELIFEFLKQNGVKESLEDFIKEMFMYFANKALDERKINIFDKKVSGEIVAAILFAIGNEVYDDVELMYNLYVSSLGSTFEYTGEISTKKEKLLKGKFVVNLKSNSLSYIGKVLFEKNIHYSRITRIIKLSNDLCYLVYERVKNPLRKFISILFLSALSLRNNSLETFYPVPIAFFSKHRIYGKLDLY